MTSNHGAKNRHDKVDVLVVGAGPAGLMAADVMASAGRQVVLTDAMPSVGRKFLMAGKSGLNLTKSEPDEAFIQAFGPVPPDMVTALAGFGPDQVVDWTRSLGIDVFTGTTGRVFPTMMKASPLLRAWTGRLGTLNVEFRKRWRWTSWDDASNEFTTADGRATITANVTIFALGGASWPRLGSTGDWAGTFRRSGIEVTPFKPANVGFHVDWSDHMRPHFGAPVKNSRLTAGTLSGRGEWVISQRGIEGGGIYEVSAPLRDGATFSVDLAPDLSEDEVFQRLNRQRGKASLSNHLRKRLGLAPVARGLLMEWGRPLPTDTRALARLIKALPARLGEPLPMDGAISTAGGVAWEALDGFRLRDRPGAYVAGEMLDWEAPTGGYLITGCLATGRAAAQQALREVP